MPIHQSLRHESPRISLKEVKEHANRDSCWIVVDGFVYDVTSWLPRHPGGDVVIVSAAGTDVTDLFNAYHPPRIRMMLKAYLVGRLEEYKVDKTTEKFRKLAAFVESSDLMTPTPMFYVRLVLWYISLLAAAVACIVYGKQSFFVSVVCGGILMAAYFQQIAFIGRMHYHFLLLPLIFQMI